MLLYVVAAAVCAVAAVCRLLASRRPHTAARLAKAFPHGPVPSLLTGNLHQHPGNGEAGLAWLRSWAARSPGAFLLRMGPLTPSLLLCDPQTVRAVLKSSEPKPKVGLMAPYRLLQPWIGDGLLLSDGPKWFRHRKLLTPAFHFDVLKTYQHVFNASADKFIAKMEVTGGKSTEIYGPVSLMTLEAILKCAFSYTEDVQTQGTQHPYVAAVHRMADIATARIFNPLLLFDWLFHLLPSGREFESHCRLAHNIADTVIQRRKQQIHTKVEQGEPELAVGRKCVDFVDLLLLARDEDGHGLTDRQVRDEVDTFLFEGHDTTASAISWVLYTLAQHPEHQERCRQELERRLTETGTNGVQIQGSDLAALPHLTRCVKEALRLHSPVSLVGRQTTQDLDLGGGRVVPAGVNVEVWIYLIHHNPDVWGADHEEFRPERFEQENLQNMDPYAFMPFSAGSRNCIGQNFAMNEIKTVLARILHRFRLEPDPSHTPEHKLEIVMRSKDGIYIKFIPRN